MKHLYLALIAALLATGCKKSNDVNGYVTFTGVLKVQGATTYQYGTHTISNGSKSYVLRSSAFSLDSYADQRVTVSGNKVPGYPVEGGPEYVDVTSVER